MRLIMECRFLCAGVLRAARQRQLPIRPSSNAWQCSWYHKASSNKDQRKRFRNPSRTETSERKWGVPFTVSMQLRRDVLEQRKYRNTPLYSVPVKIDASKIMANDDSDEHQKAVQPTETRGFEERMAMAHELNDAELLRLLRDLSWQARAEHNNDRRTLRVLKLAKSLEMELCSRINKFDVDTLLFITDSLYLMGHKPSSVVSRLLERVHLKWASLNLNSRQVIHVLYWVGAYREIPPGLVEDIQRWLLENIGSLSAQDVGLVCHAFFASNTAIRDITVLQCLAKAVIEKMKYMPSYMLGNVMKAFKHGGFQDVEFYEKFGDIVSSQRHDISHPSLLMHIAVGFSTVRIYHRQLFNQLSMELSRASEQVRNLKTWTRSLWAFTMMQHTPPVVASVKLIQGFREKPELMQQFPASFMESLHVLAMNGIYPEDLLDYALSPEFLLHKQKSIFEQDFQWLLLNEAVALECPGYKGHRLSQETIDRMLAEGIGNLPLQLLRRKGLMALYQSLQDQLPDPDMVRCRFILTHSRIPDIELVLDKDNRPLMLEQPVLSPAAQSVLDDGRSMQSLETLVTDSIVEKMLSETKRRLTIENQHILPAVRTTQRKIIIKLYGENQYVLNAPILLGSHQMELRLLSKLGYEVFTINPTTSAILNGLGKERCQPFVQEQILKRIGINLDCVPTDHSQKLKVLL